MNLNKTLFYLTVLNQNNNINKEKNLKIFLNPTDRTQKYFSEISEKFHHFCSYNPTIHNDFLKYILYFLNENLIYINDDNTVHLSSDGLKVLKKHKVTSINKLDDFLLINNQSKKFLKNDEDYTKAIKLLHIINDKRKHKYTTIDYLKTHRLFYCRIKKIFNLFNFK